MSKNLQKHPFEPFFDENSKVLILGSFPPNDFISSQNEFFYPSGKNRFWKIMETIFDLDKDTLFKGSVNDKKAFLKSKHIAISDIFEMCDRKEGSSADKDINIDNCEIRDISQIIKKAKIKRIFLTIGEDTAKKWKVKEKLFSAYADIIDILPSTSRASQRKPGYDTQSLCEKYKVIKEELER